MSSASDVLEHYEFSRVLRINEAFSMDLFDTWLNALKIQGRSKKTLAQYEYVVGRLLSDLNTPIRNITVYHIRNWLAKEKARGVSDCTLENSRQVFSSMFGWLWREGLIETNPTNNIGAIKVQKKVREPYTEVEIETLKSSCASSRHPLRDIAIISFLLATGCRVGEVVGIQRNDIDFQNKEVVVLGKGNKERKVYLDEVAGMALKEYLEHRMDDNPALFVNHSFERLTNGGVRAMLKDLATLANVEHVHPHKFRRTLATNLQRRGIPIQEVAHILCHEKLDTTLKYTVLNDDDVKNDYRKYTV
jgi:site-specific recombinase XerD